METRSTQLVSSPPREQPGASRPRRCGDHHCPHLTVHTKKQISNQKPPGSSVKRSSLGITTKNAAGPFDFRAVTDVDPKGEPKHSYRGSKADSGSTAIVGKNDLELSWTVPLKWESGAQ